MCEALGSNLGTSYKSEIVNVRYLDKQNRREDTEVHSFNSIPTEVGQFVQ